MLLIVGASLFLVAREHPSPPFCLLINQMNDTALKTDGSPHAELISEEVGPHQQLVAQPLINFIARYEERYFSMFLTASFSDALCPKSYCAYIIRY